VECSNDGKGKPLEKSGEFLIGVLDEKRVTSSFFSLFGSVHTL